MTIYVNTDVHARVWTTLTNPATGATLRLALGETADLDPAAVAGDPFLKPVVARSRMKEPTPEAAAAPVPAPSEEK